MIDPALWNQIPIFRRARGDRLYGADGRHWVDLWKQDGAWLLGRRPDHAAREWKNQLDKGLAGWLPSAWPRRLEPLIRTLVPGASTARLSTPDAASGLPVWRPWRDNDEPMATPHRVVLPSGPASSAVVAYPDSVVAPDHAVTSPAEAAAHVKAAASLLRALRDERIEEARRSIMRNFDRLILPLGVLIRDGSWIRSGVPEDRYGDLFKAMLERGFLLPPSSDGWGVLPLELSAGEWKAWRSALAAWKEGSPWNS